MDNRRKTIASTFVLCCASLLFTRGSAAQNISGEPDGTSVANQAVAYVYVTNGNKIDAFAAASNGKLSKLPGSPFATGGATEGAYTLGVSSKFLFTADLNGVDIDSFSIGSNGGLRYLTSTNISEVNAGCGLWLGYPLILDHTDATLYLSGPITYGATPCSAPAYVLFRIDESTGGLVYLADSGPMDGYGYLTFAGNNKSAYEASCNDVTPPTPFSSDFHSFRRTGNGMLTNGIVQTTMPVLEHPSDYYCLGWASADSANHVAVALAEFNADSQAEEGPVQLATYTANGQGDLTTESAWDNMPSVSVASKDPTMQQLFQLNDLKMSPSGRLLAVAGRSGLQVFHFNGADQITPYTQALTKHYILECFWDNDNHLYALSLSGQLFVFTVTPTGYSEAPNSPYSFSKPQHIAVLPLPKK